MHVIDVFVCRQSFSAREPLKLKLCNSIGIVRIMGDFCAFIDYIHVGASALKEIGI